MIETAVVIKLHCKTQLAAKIRSSGITSLKFTNKTPIISNRTTTITAKALCVITAVQNTFFIDAISPLPIS